MDLGVRREKVFCSCRRSRSVEMGGRRCSLLAKLRRMGRGCERSLVAAGDGEERVTGLLVCSPKPEAEEGGVQRG